MALRISADLTLPDDAVTETFAILAIRGAGKTYTGKVFTEELTKAHHQVVVLDPLGVWWGLRSSAKGDAKGLPFVILGGDHGDLPLEDTAGEVIANLVVDQPVPLVLDLSHMRKAAMRRFVAAFLDRLYHQNREALHLMIDEADLFAPQRPMRDETAMLGAMEDIVRRGRARGLGVTLITQRAAVLHKDVLTQCSTLVALRTSGKQDLDAMDAWVQANGTKEERDTMMSSLAALPTGTAWVWSPHWLAIFKKVRIRLAETFDSSATPKPGQRRVEPKAFALVDLEALKASMAQTVERAEANDPKRLRAQIVRLEKELVTARAATPESVVERVEVPVPVLDRAILVRLEELLGPVAGVLGQVQDRLAWEVTERASGELEFKRTLAKPHALGNTMASPRPRAISGPAAPAPAGARSSRPEGERKIGAGERAVLIAASQYPSGATREQLTILTGYKRSTRDAYVQRLRLAELVDVVSGLVVATETGIAVLGDDYEPLPTGAELRAYWLGRLPEGERAILTELIEAFPDPLPRDVLSDLTGYKRSTRDAYIQRLRVRQLVTTNGDPRAADTLFEP